MCESRVVAAPTGTNVLLEHGSYRAVVVQVGAGLRTLTRSGLDLVAGYEPGQLSTGGRGQVLLPWPNRVEDGRYRFADEDWQLSLNEPEHANAIHGLVRWLGWDLVAATTSSARWRCHLYPQAGYGGELELEVSYGLTDDGLCVETSATNAGERPAPYGAGAHPYLTVGRPIDGCELRLPAAQRCPSDSRGLPGPPEPVGTHGFDFRRRRRIGATVFDDAFGSLDHVDGRAEAELRDPDSDRSVRLWVDTSYRWLQVYSGEGQGSLSRQALAVEPMTCPPNAFVTTVGLVVLEPGDTHRAVFGIS